MNAIQLSRKDALVVVNIQNDFLPGGSLAVPNGDEIIPVLNRYIELFVSRNLPIYATRDWHPADHCSFKAQGGTWPPHCIVGTWGAQFAPELALPESAMIVSKATARAPDAYSGFEETDLALWLNSQGMERLFIGGLSTDYCVLNTVTDALALNFKVVLLTDAIRAVNVYPEDGQAAVAEMVRRGAVPISLSDIKS
jgi:nicotinamidase/pyrazinamidase